MKTFPLQVLSAGLAFVLSAGSLAAQADISLDLTDPGKPGDLKKGNGTLSEEGLTPGLSLGSTPSSPDATPANNKPFTVSPLIIEALKENTPEERESFARHLAAAARLMQSSEVQASLEHILEAEAISIKYFALHNLKGAAFSKVRDFEKARVSFAKCLELKPDSLEAKFNLAEMDFVQKDYEKAFEAFNSLLSDNPVMPAQTRNLLLYKNYLCLLVLDRSEEAEAILEKFRFDSDTPEYYFGNAAKYFQAEDKEEARGWLKSAARVYDRSLQTLFLDSIIEIGWIETL